MNEELVYLLHARRLPGRILSEPTAVLLGFEKHDIPILIRGKFLKPLGAPKANSTKWFATSEIIRLSADREFLSKATAYLQNKWRAKNQAAKEKENNNGKNSNKMAV